MTELLLDSDEIRRSLDTSFLGRSVYCFDSTTSTQDEARALLEGFGFPFTKSKAETDDAAKVS